MRRGTLHPDPGELDALLDKIRDDSLRVLDLSEPSVRAAVVAFDGGTVTALYESEAARPYA